MDEDRFTVVSKSCKILKIDPRQGAQKILFLFYIM